jgi:hypothetical protein
MSVKLPGPLFFFFFFLMGFVFCVSYYSTRASCTRFTLVLLKMTFPSHFVEHIFDFKCLDKVWELA